MGRPKRWAKAVSDGQSALASMRELFEMYHDDKTDKEGKEGYAEKFANEAGNLEGALCELEELRGEYEEWFGNMPESLQQGPTGEKLDVIINIDVDTTVESSVDEVEESDMDSIDDVLSECENAELPRGFGRD